jgi:diguanylate cyclase (GGDEF)-like protein/PAS domain S-box-containing protein
MPLQPQVWQALALNGALGLLVVVALALLPLGAASRPSRRAQTAAGLLFGTAGVLSIFTPMEFAPGWRLDLAAPSAALGAFAVGPVTGAVVVVLAAATRLLHGSLSVSGLAVLLVAAFLGALWGRLRGRRIVPAWLAIVGVAVCVPPAAWLGSFAEASAATVDAALRLSTLALAYGAGLLVLGSLVDLVLGRSRARHHLHNLNRKLLQREQELLQVLEASGGGRWQWDLKTERPSFRGSFYDAFGIAEPGRITNWQQWRGLWHPDDVETLTSLMKSNYKARKPDFDAEFRLKDKDGNWRWLLSRGRITERDAQGRPLRMVGMHHDITAQREVQEALRISQAKFATMYHAMPDAAGMTRISDGHYLEVNPAFCAMLGYTREEVIGKTARELKIWETEDEREKLVQEFRRRGQVDGLELQVQRRDGHLFPGRMSARRLVVAGEDCFFFLFHQTADQKKVEAELREANALLQQAGRMATLGVWAASPEAKGHYWSGVVYDIHGMDPALPVPENYVDKFVAPAYQRQLRQAFSDCVRHQASWDCELEIERCDGRQVWVRVLGEPVLDNDRVVQMRGVIQDIDDARRNLERLRQSEDLFSRMFQLAPDPLGISRQRNGHLLEVNPAWEQWLGYSRTEALGRNVVELGILDANDRAAMIERATATGELTSWEVALTTRGGDKRIGLQSIRAIEIEGEQCWLFVVRDITERRRSEAIVREREELLSLTIEAASLGLWDWNLQAREISGDARWREHRGLPPSSTPLKIEDLRATALPEDPAMIAAAVQRHAEDPQTPFDVVRRVLRPDGSSRWIRALGKIVARDAEGAPLRMVGVDIDVTQQREQEVLLEQLAHFDALTGLPNRVLLADRLQHAMLQAERTGSLLGVAYLDLDGFKPVNDRFGHGAGDRLLVEIANRLKEALRAVDSVARLGGDEFVVLLADLDSTQACEQALHRVMASMAAPYSIDGERVTVTASIGTTLYPTDRSDADTLLRHADQAMYAAKQAGRNRVQIFDSAQEQASRDRQQHLQRLRQALAAREFVLYMQPKVQMREGRIVGAEALARWNHPEHGVLAPARFLPLIEGSDLEIPFGEWVIEAALAQLDAWRLAGLRMPLSINISARHLQSGAFADTLTRQLAGTPSVPAALLEIEITESAALTDLDAAIEVVESLRRIGVTVALDDFGTGYSSLTYLRRLPVDTLKIDRSFVHHMMNDSGDLAIVQGVIGLAQSFGRSVVAEGVETPEQGAMLLRMGCTLAQGYGIAAPMPADALAGWAQQWQTPAMWQQEGSARLAQRA